MPQAHGRPKWGLIRLGAESYHKRVWSWFWPPVFACEQDMSPSEGRDMRQKLR